MNPQPSKYYQHRYGGVYEVLVPLAKSTIDKSEWVVYNHVWPFDPEVWIRPYAEWTDGRFKELSTTEIHDLFDRNRLEFQAEITAARTEAKKPKEGDVSLVNGKVADFKDGKWVGVQG